MASPLSSACRDGARLTVIWFWFGCSCRGPTGLRTYGALCFRVGGPTDLRRSLFSRRRGRAPIGMGRHGAAFVQFICQVCCRLVFAGRYGPRRLVLLCGAVFVCLLRPIDAYMPSGRALPMRDARDEAARMCREAGRGFAGRVWLALAHAWARMLRRPGPLVSAWLRPLINRWPTGLRLLQQVVDPRIGPHLLRLD